MLPKKLQFIHPYLFYVGLVLMVAGLPFSVFLMSFSQFWIIGNWILEGNYPEKIRRFLSNRDALLFSGILLLLLPGMLYSDNLKEGFKMLRLNLPFLIFPFVLAGREPLSRQGYLLLIRLFLLSVLLSSLVCSLIGLPRWLEGAFQDIRQISLFISHIRFSLLICFAILLIGWILFYKPFQLKKAERLAWLLCAAWLLIFLLILQSVTGLGILLFLITCWAMVLAWKKLKPGLAILITVLPLLLIATVLLYGVRTYREYATPAPVSTADSLTARGNLYQFDFSEVEHGQYVHAYVNNDELRETWNARSRFDFDSLDSKGHLLRFTLVRYLNSKGLRKDAEAMNHLSDKEIRFVEQGIANVQYTGLWGIRMRFYQILWEINQYRQGNMDASGRTFILKYEFWQTAAHIIREHPLTGVGIGDVPDEFRNQYQEDGSRLERRWWMTSHNQYLYILTAAGIPGFCLFLFCFLFPGLRNHRLRTYPPFILFLAIAALSMLTEDTLTTQAGVSFVVFFYSLFLFSRPPESASS